MKNDYLDQYLLERIRCIPDFPSPGILFRDISPVLADSRAMKYAISRHMGEIDDLWSWSLGSDPDGNFRETKIAAVCGIESRGFLFGMPLAAELNTGFFFARKPNKLPWKKIEEHYALEYGADCLSIHEDAVKPGDQIVIVDDLLATGGTAAAAARLVERLGGTVAAILVFIELVDLKGREKLDGRRVESVFKF